jgi:hypothetical protein
MRVKRSRISGKGQVVGGKLQARRAIDYLPLATARSPRPCPAVEGILLAAVDC